jgi:predicted acyl esterase
VAHAHSAAQTRLPTFYLNDGGRLSNEAPADEGFDEYVSDPKKPVPSSKT